MIEITGLSKLFGNFTAVRDLTFTVRPGEVLGLVGPNGAGKTTTLRTIGRHHPAHPRAGVASAGTTCSSEPIKAKRALAFFPDEPRLFDYLTVRQHLAFVARLYGVDRSREPSRSRCSRSWRSRIAADKLPGELSRGMKQKLAIACGLLHSPSVMIFDEPLTGLDPLGIRRMKDSILRRAQAGAAIVLSSHLLHLLEEVCSHVLILKKGERIADGTMAEVHAQFSDGDATRASRTCSSAPRAARNREPARQHARALLYLRVTSLVGTACARG